MPGGDNNDDPNRRVGSRGIIPDPIIAVGDRVAASSHTTEEEDDDWSRQVETDEALAVHDGSLIVTESILGDGADEENASNANNNTPHGSNNNIGSRRRDDDQEDHHAHAAAGPPVLHDEGETNDQGGSSRVLRPSQPELTMKEKLVLRERERRIETERARLKRQFAMSNHEHRDHDHHHDNGSSDNNANDRPGVVGSGAGGSGEMGSDNDLVGGNNVVGGGGGGATESVATLGEESTMVHPDLDESSSTAADQASLPVTMERFLRNNSDSFNPQLEPTNEETGGPATDGVAAGSAGVLMERFLNDPVVVEAAVVTSSSAIASSNEAGTTTVPPRGVDHEEVQRSVSFDVERSAASQQTPGPQDRQDVNTSLANASIQVQPDEENVMLDNTIASSDDTPLHDMTSSGMPTTTQNPEDEAGGAVPRLTEADLQEMVATEEESIANYPPSEREDNLSEVGELADFPILHQVPRGDVSQDTPTTAVESYAGSEKPPSAVSSDRHSVDDGAGSANDDTVAAQPPSERDILSPVMDVSEREQRDIEVTEEMKQPPFTAQSSGAGEGTSRGQEGDDSAIVNRRIRPGMVGLVPAAVGSVNPNLLATPPGSTPPAVKATAVVDDFDFHDGAPKSPGIDNDSYRELPDDLHHGFHSPEMHVSPIVTGGRKRPNLPDRLDAAEYGALAEEGQASLSRAVIAPRGLDDNPNASNVRAEHVSSESTPLIPLEENPPPIPEIFTKRDKTGDTSDARRGSLESLRYSLRSRINSIFSDVRSEEEETKIETNNESEAYLKSSTFSRAVPERIFALTITLLLEIPVLLMISGGSDALCELVGRRRYQLLVSFIPLTSAISGNVGLQASTLTTRAISHEHVTEDDFLTWLGKEIGAACYLGLGMGAVLGVIAFAASQLDFAFALTIMIAQFVSIVTAGITGSIAPLLFSFIFQRDSGKWGGPLETAIQDIVGSFAMVVMSYHILSWLGTGEIDPTDSCGGGGDAVDATNR